MAEVASLAIGSTALLELFINCVDAFQYIQLGRNFGKDYETSLLKLDVIKLRFTRWGELMGIQAGGELENLKAVASPAEQEIVERLLGQILEVFQRAKQTSQTLQMIRDPSELIIDTQSRSSNLTRLHDCLQSKIQKRCSERQKRTNLTTKVKWALYKKAHFDRLIEDLTELVDALSSMFPAPEESQRQLCAAEVADIEKDECLVALKRIAQGSDKVLEEVVVKTLDDRGGQFWRNIKASGNAEQFLGNGYGVDGLADGRQVHQEWDDISATDSAKQHMGNVYGYCNFANMLESNRGS